jgi:hypothetical protein
MESRCAWFVSPCVEEERKKSHSEFRMFFYRTVGLTESLRPNGTEKCIYRSEIGTSADVARQHHQESRIAAWREY